MSKWTGALPRKDHKRPDPPAPGVVELADDIAILIRVSRLVPMDRDHMINVKSRFMAEVLLSKYKQHAMDLKP